MIIDSNYRGYQIEVIVFENEDGWDADVEIRRRPSRTTMCVGRLSCRKPSATLAEESGALCARQWIDRHGRPGCLEESSGS
jgi:hypothetical protein